MIGWVLDKRENIIKVITPPSRVRRTWKSGRMEEWKNGRMEYCKTRNTIKRITVKSVNKIQDESAQ